MKHSGFRYSFWAVVAMSCATLAGCNDPSSTLSAIGSRFSDAVEIAPAADLAVVYADNSVSVTWTGTLGGRYHAKINCADAECTGNIPDNPNEINGTATHFMLDASSKTAMSGNWTVCVKPQTATGWHSEAVVCAPFSADALLTAQTQSISWTPPTATYGEAPFNLDFTSSSGNAPQLAATTGVCSVLDGVVTILSAGSCVLHYFVGADESWLETEGDITFTIAKAPLSVTLSHETMVYGGEVPFFSVSFGPFAYNDDASSLGGLVAFSGVPSPMTAGTHTVSASGLSSDNYAITYVDGTLSVARAPLTVTANAISAVYGDAPAYSASANALQYNDQLDGLGTMTYSADPSPARNVGTYSIMPSGLSTGNYDVTYAPGTLTVTPRNLTISVSPTAVQLGHTPACSVIGDDFGYDDDVQSLVWSAAPTCSYSSSPFWLSGGTQSVVGSAVSSNYNITMATSSFSAFGPFDGTAQGFLPPIAATMPARAAFKMGSNIPAKFRLIGANGKLFNDPNAKLSVCLINLETCIVTNRAFSYDVATGQHQTNVNTDRNTPLGTYVFTATLSQGPGTIVGYVEVTR